MAQENFPKSVVAVAEEHDADVFLFAGPLREDSGYEFIDECPDKIGHPNVVLYLTTNGGDPSAAYRITRCLQHRYSSGKLILVVDSMCKSAGTLIAVGAHTIAMSDCGELGPLDVQVGQRDEVFGFQSGLVAIQALETLQEQSFSYFERGFVKLTSRSGGRITTRTAAELASSLAGKLFGELYGQLDPMRLGENYRQMLVSREYATRLAGSRKVALDKLITAYPSHGFVIDRIEAGTLFPDVRELTGAESVLADQLETITYPALWANEPIVEHMTGDPADVAARLGIADKEEDYNGKTTNGLEGAPAPAITGEDAGREFATDGIGDRESAVG